MNERTKVRYATKQAALAAIAEASKYQTDIPLRVYQSPHDGGWYLTSNTSE